jgi:uncharacterized protein (TIGR02679 family)
VSRRALDPALDRALREASLKRERRGATGNATIVLDDVGPEEALALDSLLSVSRRRSVFPGARLRVSLSELETALASCGFEPREEYERVAGRPLRDLRAERARRRELRTEFREWLASQELVRARPELAAWCEEAIRTGRVHADIAALVERALGILERLSAASGSVQRTVLAAEMVGGDPHALDPGTPLHQLTVSMLAAITDLPPDAGPRDVWAAWNVVVDPISSHVAALNLPLAGAGVAVELARAAHGSHVILTYGQLAASELSWADGVSCFSCENPSVLIAAEQALGPVCPPLVCTGGWPSDAARLIFACVAGSGGQVRHHGDFDEAGLQILRDLEAHYGAAGWQFDLEALRALPGHLRQPGPHVEGPDRDTATAQPPSPIVEELLLGHLIADLRSTAISTEAPRS